MMEDMPSHILTLFYRGDYPNPNSWSALGGQTNGAYMVRGPNQIKFGQHIRLPPSSIKVLC